MKDSVAMENSVKDNGAKSEFISGMSHAIRTSMNGIIGMTAIARANINDAERVSDCLSKIAFSSRRLLNLIGDILDLNKIESGDLSFTSQTVSLREVINKLANIVVPQTKARGQKFDIFVRDIQTENVYCDGVRLNQILLNLLSNAIKFTDDGGFVRVYLRQEDSPRGQNFVRCIFKVCDNGIGMTEEFQRQIFEEFSREETQQVQETEGSGLGLAVSKAIVDAMKGTIAVKSEVGEGAEFVVTLDFERAELKEPDAIFPSQKLLIVDDDEDLCRNAANWLEEAGVKTDWATNAQIAIDMAQKNHDAGDGYKIVLIDSEMPDANILETVKSFRERFGDKIPALIISAYVWSDIEEEARKAGARGFIFKPLFKSDLFAGLSPYMLGAESKENETLEKKDVRRLDGKRVLIAEDNDLNWEIASELLSDEGLIVERAEDGLECVETFSKSEVGKYDAILMDVRMPVMTGYDATINIRALERDDANIPIIAMTADVFSDDLQRCKECGMNDHISKPIDVEKILQILTRYL